MLCRLALLLFFLCLLSHGWRRGVILTGAISKGGGQMTAVGSRFHVTLLFLLGSAAPLEVQQMFSHC